MRRLFALACALSACVVAPALAADHQFTVSSASPVHEWVGAPDITRGSPVNNPESRNQIPCDTPGVRPCEEVLFKVEEPGKVVISLQAQESALPLTEDVDGYLFESDASGARGKPLSGAAADGPDTIALQKAAPGHYLLVVDYYSAYNSAYDGRLVFTPAAPPAAPVPAVPAVPNVVTPPKAPAAPRAKPSCTTRAKKIKNRKKRAAALKKCRKTKR